MDPQVASAASALADIGHLLESVDKPSQQLERALGLVRRFVPYDCCALLAAWSGVTPGLLVVPPTSSEQQDVLRARLAVLHQLVSDRPLSPSGSLQLSGVEEPGARLAVPVIALDEAIGILLVEQAAGDYEEHHLQLLSVVAAQLGGYLANVRLQSDEKAAKQAMQRAADLLEHLDDGFLELDSSCSCVTANRAAVEMLGAAHGQIVGADVRKLFGGGGAFVEACERVMRERVSVHVEADHRGQLNRWLAFELYPTALGASVFVRDVSERRAAEEFRELLTGIIGHDLRTPLGAITVTASALLARGNLDGAVAHSIARISRSGARMGEMISQLLDVTRIRFGEGLPIRRRQADLGQVCRDVANEISAANPGHEVVCETEELLTGDWDPDRLSQVVSNLLANAIQHGDAKKPVRLSAGLAGEDRAKIEVHNEGQPISAEVLPTIFQPFRQAGNKAGRAGSLGLGLFIAQSIVLAHGGTIEVRSTPGDGTTFLVLLPRRASPPG